MTMELTLHSMQTATPLDPIHFVTRRETLIALDFGPVEGRLLRLLRRRFGDNVEPAPAATRHPIDAALRAYVGGELDALDTIPVDGGGTAFQRKVWAALRRIPPGETRRYGEIAAELGQENAARAVGHANSLNPVNLVIPCHRLIGNHGALTGYGGGLERKRWLLDHERRSGR